MYEKRRLTEEVLLKKTETGIIFGEKKDAKSKIGRAHFRNMFLCIEIYT